jgi:TolB-like protein
MRPDVLRFGAFQLSAARRELRFRGHPVNLGVRAFDLLVALVDRRGELATKDDLMGAVWPGRVVDENNLAAQISALRKVLAADPDLSRCVQTAPGQGYRFVAGVAVEAAAHAGMSGPSMPDRAGELPSLVVLPFVSLSSDDEQAYFAQGLSQTVSTDLSRISGLLVISSATAATFTQGPIDIKEVSRQLGVAYVLTGSIQRSAQRVRVTAQLSAGPSGVQIWSDLFDGDHSDLLSLQDRITGRIANSLGREIFVAAARDGEARNIDPKACDLFMRGIAADNRPQSLECLQEQEALFGRAVALDPKHADALARLARAILLQATQVHASPQHKEDMLKRGSSAAEKAVALEPGNARAHCSMGLLHVLRGDFERSALANEAAIALDRNFALAHNNLGNSLFHLGNGTDALAAIEAALRLDPRGPQLGSFWTVKGFALLMLGENGEAAACFSRARSANPRLPRAQSGLAVSLALSGDTNAARHVASELLELAPHYRLSQTIDACLPASPAGYRQFYEHVLCPGAISAGVPV